MAGTVRDNSLSGQIVANYRVGRLIGRGGMGAVYEAVHQFLGRRAALKVLHAQFSQTPELTARFVNEARAANAVQHPSVVSVFEIGQLDNGTRYILMEYLDGPPLSQRVRELAAAEGAVPPGGAGSVSPRVVSSIRLVRQLASALRALHEKGVIHRDLKPDNILIVKDPETPGGERAKLLDFGIAKFVSEYGRIEGSPFPGVPAYVKTALGALLGTPMYMGPELWRAKGNVDHRADIYSLGCILFELLTGRPPYCASAIAQLMHMHVWQNPPPVLLSRPDIPAPLASLVQKMLAKEPGERPTTSEVESVLERLLASPMGADAQPASDVSTMVIRTGDGHKAPAPLSPPAQSAPSVPSDQTMPLQRAKQIVQQVTMIPTLDPQMVMLSGGNSLHGGPSAQALPPAAEPSLPPPLAVVAAGSPAAERSPSGSAQLVPLRRMPGRTSSIASAAALVLVVIGVWSFLHLRGSYRGFNDRHVARAPWPERTVRLNSLPLAAELRDATTGKLLGSAPYEFKQTPLRPLQILVHKPGYKDRLLMLDWLSTGPSFTVKLARKKK